MRFTTKHKLFKNPFLKLLLSFYFVQICYLWFEGSENSAKEQIANLPSAFIINFLSQMTKSNFSAFSTQQKSQRTSTILKEVLML